MSDRMNRRRFLQMAGMGSAAALLGLGACAPQATPAPVVQPTTPPTVAPAPTATPAPTTAPAGPRILRVRITHDIRTLDPAFTYSDVETFVAGCIFNGLVSYAPNSYDVVNELAESFVPSEDGTVIDFKLREGVQWHKGHGEVTAEDVKFSYERYALIDSPYKDDWLALDRVEVTGKYTGKIILKEPFAPLWTSTLPVDRGWILPKKYVEEIGNEAFATNVIGTGPYYFDQWTPQQRVVLKPNPDFFGKKPAWDEIRYVPIDDDKVAEVALEAGELDFTSISVASAERFRQNPRFSVLGRPQLGYRWIGMNIEHPKLQDINVRQAIRYGIDVPSIIQAAYVGQAEQNYCLIAPGLLGHWKDAPRYQRDVAKAKEFMAKAGLQSLDLRIDTLDETEYRTWSEIAQQNLKEIGINLTINNLDSTSFWSIGEGDQGKDLELFVNSYTMMPDPAWATMWFTCEQIGMWNWMRWCNADFDALHQKGLVTLDEGEREKIYIQMQRLWDEACHTVWITHMDLIYAYPPTLKPAVTPHGLMQVKYMEPA